MGGIDIWMGQSEGTGIGRHAGIRDRRRSIGGGIAETGIWHWQDTDAEEARMWSDSGVQTDEEGPRRATERVWDAAVSQRAVVSGAWNRSARRAERDVSRPGGIACSVGVPLEDVHEMCASFMICIPRLPTSPTVIRPC